MVMEYEHGKGMHELLKNKNTLAEEKLKSIILPILDGLGQVHAEGFIHRDIKPANIFIRDDGSPVLLDFGSARQSFGQQTRTLTTMVSPGFAPFEQYVSKSDKQGPWTDIYGLGATMYRSIIGVSPAEAMDRSEGLLHSERDSYMKASELKPDGYSTGLLNAIDHALQFKPEHRPQSVEEWLSEINEDILVDQSEIETVVASESVASIIEEPKTELADAKETKKKPSIFKRLLKYTLIGFLILFILAILGENDKKKQNDLNKENSKVTNVVDNTSQTSNDDSLFTENEKERVQALQETLKSNPKDQEAKKEIQEIIKSFENKIKKAIKDGNLELALEYINQAKEIAPNSRRLNALSNRIENRLKKQ